MAWSTAPVPPRTAQVLEVTFSGFQSANGMVTCGLCTYVPKSHWSPKYYIRQKVGHWKLEWRICLYVLTHFESETLTLPIIINLLVPSVSIQQSTNCTIVASLINELCSVSWYSKSKLIEVFVLHPRNTPMYTKRINVSLSNNYYNEEIDVTQVECYTSN